MRDFAPGEGEELLTMTFDPLLRGREGAPRLGSGIPLERPGRQPSDCLPLIPLFPVSGEILCYLNDPSEDRAAAC